MEYEYNATVVVYSENMTLPAEYTQKNTGESEKERPVLVIWHGKSISVLTEKDLPYKVTMREVFP